MIQRSDSEVTVPRGAGAVAPRGNQRSRGDGRPRNATTKDVREQINAVQLVNEATRVRGYSRRWRVAGHRPRRVESSLFAKLMTSFQGVR